MNKAYITKSALIGLATGDAFGVPYEFHRRSTVRKIIQPDMIGIDTRPPFDMAHRQPAGTWSDDTSLTIAAMDSLAKNDGLFIPDSVMRAFCGWYYNGLYCATGRPFDVGTNCATAIHNFNSGVPALQCGPSGMRNNGNGSLMRILPFSLDCIFHNTPFEDTGLFIGMASSLTHGHPISHLGCLIFTVFLSALIDAESPAEAWDATKQYDYQKFFDADTMKAYETLFNPGFATMPDDVIGETGYVVDTLMAAVKSLLCTSTYEDAIIYAVRLGYDTDTFAAVTGALAGVYYGIDAIPERWLAPLRKKDMLLGIASRFANCF